MANKKGANMMMEVVIVSILVLVLLVTLLWLLRKNAGSANTSFLNFFKEIDKETGAGETQEGTQVTVYSNEPEIIAVGKEKFTINAAVSNDILTVDVKDSANNNVKCNYENPWTFKKGERKCCENVEKDICVKYESVSSTGEEGDKISLTTFSRSEWLPAEGLQQTLYQIQSEGAKSTTIWTTKGKYSIELLRVDDSVLETRHVNALVSKFTLNNKNDKSVLCAEEEESGGEKSLRVDQGKSKTCDSFILTVDRLSGRNNYADITIKNVESSATSQGDITGGAGVGEEKITE
jgi:hypothetical protein